MNTEKKTCVYDRHVQLGALMSPFGGFIMPIQYSSIIDEHNTVRNSAGFFDVSHMGEIIVKGKDAEVFLNTIFTNDVSNMPVGKVLYGMMLNHDGGVVDDLLVYKEESQFFLVVNASNIDKDFEWILSQACDFDVEIVNESDSWGQIAMQGPIAERCLVTILCIDIFPKYNIEDAKDLVKKIIALPFYHFLTVNLNGKKMYISRTGYTGEDGMEVYAPKDVIVDLWDCCVADGEVTPCGLGCRDTLRFEAGLPLYGHELDMNITPLEAGLEAFVKFDKANFIGKDALLSQKETGLTKKLVGLELHDRAIPRATYPVLNLEGEQVGYVTTGYHSISLDKSICMAYVDSKYATNGTALQIQIRKKNFPASVIPKRFYKTRYKK